MKKYLLITALCVVNFAYADGFENLKNLQNQFHLLIYNAGDLGAATPAPEVPYIAGLLTNPVQTIGTGGTGEERHIYEFLYDQPSGRNRKAIPGIDPAKVDAFNRVNFNVFQTYNGYQDSGHSVLGVAAQEQLPPIEKVMIMAAAPAGAGLFAGGGGSFELPKLRKATTKEPSTSAAATAPKSLLERVREHKETLQNNPTATSDSDIAILAALEVELAKPESERDDDKIERLQGFFNYLENPATMAGNMMAQGVMKKLRAQFKPEVPPSPSSASPKEMKMAGVNLDEEHVNRFMKRASGSALGPVKNVGSSGNTEVDTLSKALENLKDRKGELEQDDSDADWQDDEDEKPKKSAQELKQEKEELERVNTQILEKAEELAMHPQGKLDVEAIEISNDRIAIYQRIKDYLDAVGSKTTQQQKIHQQVINMLRSMNGNLGTKAPGPNVPAVAHLIDQSSPILAPGVAFNIGNQMIGGGGLAVDIDAWAESEFQRRKAELENRISAIDIELNEMSGKNRMGGPGNQLRAEKSDKQNQLRRYEGFAKDSMMSQIKKEYVKR